MRQDEKIVKKGKKLQDKIKQFSYINDGNLPLIRGIGFGKGHKLYNWNASKRKDQLVVLQVTLNGTGIFMKGDRKIELGEQTGFLAKIPENFTYYGDDWEFLYVEFSETMVQWLVDPVQVCHLSPEFIKELEKTVTDLLTLDLSVFENTKKAFSLFISILEELNPVELKENSEMKYIKEYFEKNYCLDLSLTEVAELFGISKYKLIRLFEKKVGTTPMNYLLQVRIREAVILLRASTDSIDTIAKKVGFSSSNYFSKVFKKEIGKTPTAYRDQGLFYYSSREDKPISKNVGGETFPT